MSMFGFQSCCPVVQREQRTFTERVTVGGELREIPYEREVLWVRISESTIQLRHKGRLVKEGDGYNDFDGFMTSVAWALKFARRKAQWFRTKPDGDFQVNVRVHVFDKAAFEDHSPTALEAKQKGFRTHYCAVPLDDRTVFKCLVPLPLDELCARRIFDSLNRWRAESGEAPLEESWLTEEIFPGEGTP